MRRAEFAMPDKIAAGLVSRTYFNMPLWVAQQHGFFAAEGLEVEGTIFGNASQVPPLLDGTLPGLHRLAGAGDPERRRGRAAQDRRRQRRQAGAFADRARAVQARRGSARPHDRHLHRQGRHVLPRQGDAGGARAELSRRLPGQATGGVPPRHKALLAGEIDAGLQSVPWNYVAEEAGMNNLGDVIDYVPDWQFVSINVNSQWADGQPRRCWCGSCARMRQRHRMALRQPRGGVRDRRARTAGAAASRRARLGFLHRHQRADPRHVGQHGGACAASSPR